MTAKNYTPEEERWNAATHLAGALLAIAGLAVLLKPAENALQYAAPGFYMASMTALFAVSAIYHMTKKPERKAFWRKLDHSAIHLLISGTYAPLMLLTVGGTYGKTVFAVSLLLSVIGIPSEVLGFKPFKAFSLTLYLMSGWLCLCVMPLLWRNLSAFGFTMLLAGGIFYTAGVKFYTSSRKYAHTLWHVFVLAGAFCHYLAVWSNIYRF